MRKYLLPILIIILITYYISTFVISFTLLSKSVVNNDPISLKKYINVTELKKHFYNDIYVFGSSLIKSMDKNVNIESESIKLTGELTPKFLEKLFSKMSNNISTDFSNPKIMLYFYFSSKELSTYLNKSFTYFGNYNFEMYLLDIQPKETENSKKNEKETKKNEKEEKKKEEKEEIKEEKKEDNIFLKFIKKIKSTDYFFLTTPIHFKIEVKHQDIPFILILKFNGIKWKVQKITIPYKKLIDPKNISLSN